MRVTVTARPGTIGFVALFAEVPGQWVAEGENYVKVSDEGFSAFMLNEFIATSGPKENHSEPKEAVKLERNLNWLFDDKSQVAVSAVKMFTVEQGSENLDFTRTVEEWFEAFKSHQLEREMKKFDREVERLFSQFSNGLSYRNKDSGFRVYAIERFLQKLEEVDSVERLKDISYAREFNTYR